MKKASGTIQHHLGSTSEHDTRLITYSDCADVDLADDSNQSPHIKLELNLQLLWRHVTSPRSLRSFGCQRSWDRILTRVLIMQLSAVVERSCQSKGTLSRADPI